MSSFWGKEGGGSVVVMSASHELVNDNDLDYNEDDDNAGTNENHSTDIEPAKLEEGEEGEVDDAEDGEVKDDDDSEDEELIKKKIAEKQAEVRRQQLADLTGKKHPPVEAPDGVRDDRSDDFYSKDYTEETYEYRPGGAPPHGQFPLRMRVDPALTVCKFYLSGYCRRGDTCAFIHMDEVRRNPNVPPHLSGRVGPEGEAQSQVVEVVKRRRVSSTSSDSSDDLPPAKKRMMGDRSDRRSRDEPQHKRSRDESRNRRDRQRDCRRPPSRGLRSSSPEERRRRPSNTTSRHSDRSPGPIENRGRRDRRTPVQPIKRHESKENKRSKQKRRASDSSSSSSSDDSDEGSSSKSSRGKKKIASKRSDAAAISSEDEKKGRGPRTPPGSPPNFEVKETRSREELVEQLRNIEEMLTKHKQKHKIVDNGDHRRRSPLRDARKKSFR